jgi:hypothetical protein
MSEPSLNNINFRTHMQLGEELSKSVSKYRNLGRLNYYVSFLLYIVAVLSSISATLMALSGNFSGPFQATVTAIPGGALLIANTFRFNERARWHYNKKNQLNALYRLFVAQAPGTSPPELAEKWNKIDSAMEASWPGFGALSGSPPGPRKSGG